MTCLIAAAKQSRKYHGVAAVAGQDDDVDGWCVVGDANSAILGFVFTVNIEKQAV